MEAASTDRAVCTGWACRIDPSSTPRRRRRCIPLRSIAGTPVMEAASADRLYAQVGHAGLIHRPGFAPAAVHSASVNCCSSRHGSSSTDRLGAQGSACRTGPSSRLAAAAGIPLRSTAAAPSWKQQAPTGWRTGSASRLAAVTPRRRPPCTPPGWSCSQCPSGKQQAPVGSAAWTARPSARTPSPDCPSAGLTAKLYAVAGCMLSSVLVPHIVSVCQAAASPAGRRTHVLPVPAAPPSP